MYGKLVIKVNAFDANGLDLRTDYNTDKSGNKMLRSLRLRVKYLVLLI